MADNPSVDPGPTPSIPVAGDDVGGAIYQRVKLRAADDGTAGADVSASNPLPVVQTGTPGLPTGAATAALQTAEATLVGAVTETAPGTDTASSGLNGRLQRIAQNITTLLGRLPGALGANGGLKIEGVASGTVVPVADGGGSLTVDGTVTANAGTGPFPVSDNAGSLTVDAPVGTPVFARLSDGTAALTTTGSRLAVDGSGVTQPVSGTVTANIGTVGTLATEATQTAQSTLYGAVTETAPGTDTASSGLNGRLQRIAQNITTLLGRLPAALGQTTKAGSLSVTLASNQDALPITDNSGSLTVDNAGTFAVQADTELTTADVDTGAGTDTRAVVGIVTAASGGGVLVSAANPLPVTGGGGGTQYVEDVASAGGETVTLAGAIRQDSLASSTSTDGDFANLKVNAAGSLYVTGAGGGTQFAEDAAHVSGDLGTQSLAVRKDTATALSGTDGDYTPLISDASGRLHVNGSGVTQPVSGALSVSGTMPVSVAAAQEVDGHSANIGALADASSASTLTGLLKAIKAAITGTLTVSGTVTTTPPSNASSNVAQINGVTPLMGTGNTGTGSLRVTLATDQTALTNALKVDPSAVTSPVSAASLPLPTGAATEATLAAQTKVDNAAFTDGTTPVSPVGYVFDEVAGTALTENDVAAARIDSKRGQVSVLEDATTRGQRAAVSAGGALKVDGSAATQPVSGTVTTTPPSNASTNVAQVAGTTTDTNSGTKSAGTQRIVIATDQPALTNALKVDGSAVTQPISGTVAVSGTMPVSQANPVQSATATLANVAGSASSVTLQASNAARKGLVIVNDSTAILYVKFGTTASTTSYTYFLAGSVGGVPATLELPAMTYTGRVDGIWASAVGNARVTELT